MKKIALILFIALAGSTWAQEKIYPLINNPAILKNKTQTRASEFNNLDSTFIYEFGVLDIKHAWDDFSVNKFEKFDADYTDGGVTSELFYHLMDETNTNPIDPELTYCTAEFAHHDTVKVDADGLEIETVTHYPFTEHDIWVNDLDFYPVTGGLVEDVYEECYVLIDSIIDGILDADQDTVWYNTRPIAYVQDSARVFTKFVTDTNVLWTDNYAYHNYTFAYQPWSLGVATLDGVDENGWPYDIGFGTDDTYGEADYLTSRPINLFGKEDVYLTFLYQAKGFGNEPEERDSLLLDFWDVSEQEWVSMRASWFGVIEDVVPNEWDTAHIAVPPAVLENGFRFRFRNYASISGALDHWHIDYVNLQEDAFPTADNFSDLAISYPLNTLLQDYTAVPWDHYKATSGNEKMLDQSDLFVYNSDLTATFFAPGAFEIRKDGVLQGGSPYAIPSTGIPEPNYVTGMNSCLFNVGGDYFYDQSLGGDKADFDVKVNIASSVLAANQYAVNDTTYFNQRFSNYYAYDDGSAEAAYGVSGAGSEMAYKFESYQAGRLTGILIHFVPSVIDYSGEIFLLTVWADNDGEPGEIIYQDDYFQSHSPEYSGSKEGFRYYEFYNTEYLNEDMSLNVDEVFYVGWQNVNPPSLNVGLDWNIGNGDKVFKNTDGSWETSLYDLSLMIRPVFSTALDYTLSDEENNQLAETPVEISLYPNPTNNQFTVTGLTGNFELRLFDLSGRLVTFSQNEHIVDVSDLEKGVYMVDIRNEFGESIHSARLIKQ